MTGIGGQVANIKRAFVSVIAISVKRAAAWDWIVCTGGRNLIANITCTFQAIIAIEIKRALYDRVGNVKKTHATQGRFEGNVSIPEEVRSEHAI